MPPKAAFEQATNSVEALAKGRSRRGEIALMVLSLSDEVPELIQTATCVGSSGWREFVGKSHEIWVYG